MVEPKVECVVNADGKLGLGEGPHWDHKNQRLFWLEILQRFDETKGKSLHIYDPSSTSDRAIKLTELVTSVVPRRKSNTSVVVTFGRNFGFLDFETQKIEIIKTVDNERPKNRFNDGKCDALGRYWAGTMGPEPVPLEVVPEQGSMYCLETGASEAVWKYNELNISNGIGWSNDNKTMYHVDSLIRKIYAFDFDLETGALKNKRVAIDVLPEFGVRLMRRTTFESAVDLNPKVVEVPDSFPDGMTVDSEDKLWVAMYDGGQVVHYDPSSGSVLRKVKLPVSKITSCCWGGKNLDELYVTSEGLAKKGPGNLPLAGSLFKITNLNCKGLPGNEYDG